MFLRTVLSPTLAVFYLALCPILIAAYRLLFHPLARVPGPKLAAITSWWHIRQVGKGKTFQLALHDKYGPIVRIAPNEVICNSGEAFDAVYKASGAYAKGAWYGDFFVRRPHPKGLALIGEMNMDRYKFHRRSIGPVYSTSSMKNHERRLSEALDRICDRIRKFNGADLSTADWVHVMILECLSAIMWSGTIDGMLEDGYNYDDLQEPLIEWQRGCIRGLLPFMDQVLVLVPSLKSTFYWFAGLPTNYAKYQVGEVNQRGAVIGERIMERFKTVKESKEANCDRGGDLVEQLMTVVREKPGFGESEALAMIFTTIGAGHETTASTTISILSRICSDPDLQKLVEQETRGERVLTAFDERALDVTGSCIKETMRLHSITDWSLVRTVPANGVRLHGYWLPAGTNIGCNPTVLPRSVELFGPDAAEFKPARWLDPENKEQVKKMEKYNLMFGSATRSCPGQNIARLIVGTIIPRLFREFDIEMELPPDSFENYPPIFLTLLRDSRIRFLEKGY